MVGTSYCSFIYSYLIEYTLLEQILGLYSNTSLKVRLDLYGQLSNSVKTSMGMHQGCILVPLSFNLYINDMVDSLQEHIFSQ